MQLSQSLSMRPELRQLLTPRMIQSMEILQLPLAALEERIEQELQCNPVLEFREGESEPEPIPDGDPADGQKQEFSEDERALVVKEDSAASDFDRLAKISEYLENEEFATNGASQFRQVSSYDGERDKKLDAMNNTAARSMTLAEHLMGQWAFIECSAQVRRAGEEIIKYIDPEGYLRTDLETIEPSGVGARNLPECLLLQLEALRQDEEAAEGHDFELEKALITDHLKDLEMNRYPQISKRLGRPIDELKVAVKRLGRLHPYP